MARLHMLPTAFFEPESDLVFTATELTRGPWDNRAQHGGPPAALLARAIERHDPDFFTSRITVELLRPIPLATLRVAVTVVRSGGKAQWLSASLFTEQHEVARATAVRIRTSKIELPPPRSAPPAMLAPPSAAVPFEFGFFRHEVGYHRAVEVRWLSGEWAKGPSAAWIRPRVPLVAGEETAPLASLLIVADAANGICPVLPFDRFVFINPDLTVALARPLHGGWCGLDVTSHAATSGTGMVHGTVHDEAGPVGTVTQTLIVQPIG